MQDVIIEKPYRFVPPLESPLWPTLLRPWVPGILRRKYGVFSVRVSGAERLKESIAQGRGVLLAPNHCRDSDPLALGALSAEAGRPLFIMASWHLFMQAPLQAWLLRAAGAFSVYREGLDRASLAYATGVIEEGRRPLVLFPEGVITRTNDRLNALMEGTALIARQAAKKRAKDGARGGVVIHPVGIRYKLLEPAERVLPPAIELIERRLGWQPQRGLGLLERILKSGHALLCLQEIERFGHEQAGTLRERIERLVDDILGPLEKEWTAGASGGSVVARVKRLRAAILPELLQGALEEAERERRWRQLAGLYLAQQLDHYPEGYLTGEVPPERLLETIERYEEDLTDAAPPRARLEALVRVGEAVQVLPDSDGKALMAELEAGLRSLLGLAREP